MHTVVIGGGIIGLTTAFHLVHEGVTVTLVDARSTGLGATDVNAGWIVPADAAPLPGPGAITSAIKWMMHPDSPLYIRPSLKPSFLSFMLGMARVSNARSQHAGFAANLLLIGDSLKYFDEYLDDGMDYELHDSGLLMAFMEKGDLEDHLELLDLIRFCGLEPLTLLGDEVRVHEPLLSDAVAAGLYFPKERSVDPASLARALRKRLTELGVEIIEGHPIDKVELRDNKVMSVSSGTRRFTGDSFVLAAGAWTGPLSKLFGYSLPIRPGKGYCIDVEPFGLNGPTNLSDAKVAVAPLSDRLRLAGTMEFGGLDETINQVRVDAILRAPGLYFRDWEPPRIQIKPKAGMRPMTPDGIPIIGRLGKLKNTVVSTGHGMLGVTMAPACAVALAQLIVHDNFAPILAPYSAARFARNR